MNNDSLEQKLKQRELLSLIGKDSNDNSFEVRYYDTGQFWIKGKKKSEKRYMECKRRISEEVFEDCYIIYSPSHGLDSRVYDSVGCMNGGTGVMDGAEEMYSSAVRLLQEKGLDVDQYTGKLQDRTAEEVAIDEFVEDLHNIFASTKWKKHEHPLEYLPVVLAGHGNIPPWAVFHPQFAAQIAKDFVFPFHEETGFSLSKGRRKLEEQNLIEKNPGKYVCLLKKNSYERDKDFVQVIDAFFFKKENLDAFKKGDYKVGSKIPSMEDTVFEITYIFECGKKSVHFSEHKFDMDYLRREGLLESRNGGMYLKVEDLKKNEEGELIPRNFWILNENFFKTLERRADLPLYILK
ncbi:hypothetical protein HY837_00665 [archaeon]|nr:hypothetical protein [archaeon]